MELKAHFTNIHKVIIDHLEQARSEIVAAIAWFTDRDLFDVLCRKAGEGVAVSVALIGDDINKGAGGLNFQRLRDIGGRVIFLPPGSRDAPTMHHKFCVIDREKVITGSYNWSQNARSNDENITVVTESADFADKYLGAFDDLLLRAASGAPVVVDTDALRRRLELIRSLILLGELDDIPANTRKLRPVAETHQIAEVIDALESGKYQAALERIDACLRKATAVVTAGSADIPFLRLQLEALELRLESLTDEKADLEHRLITFSRRHDEELGDLIQRLLKARAELARIRAAQEPSGQERIEAEAAARDAEDAYQDYAKQHEELLRAPRLPRLDEDAERELKLLYRKACSLCHPDKVPEERKAASHRVFVELQDAYNGNDLPRLRTIYETLKAGGAPGTRASTLTDAEALRAAVAELEYRIGRVVAELKALQASEGVRLMDAAGGAEASWQDYFDRQRRALEIELATIVSDILAHEEDTEFP